MIQGDVEASSDSCIKLRTEHCPDKLYKYYSYSDNSLDSLKRGYLYLSDIQKLNDPLECFIEAGNHRAEYAKQFLNTCKVNKLLFPNQSDQDAFLKKIEEGSLFKDELLHLLLDKIPSVYPYIATNPAIQKELGVIDNLDKELTDLIKNKVCENIYVGCLSTKKDIIPMWSYYADSHRGFVVEYQITDAIKRHCFPMFYTSCPINYDLFIKNKCLYYLLCLKFEKWEHEQEWRIIRSSDQGHELPVEATAVYFGLRSYDKFHEKKSIENAIKIAKIINELQIPTYKMKPGKSNYSLISTPQFIPNKDKGSD
jgi:hypothetical protein